VTEMDTGFQHFLQSHFNHGTLLLGVLTISETAHPFILPRLLYALEKDLKGRPLLSLWKETVRTDGIESHPETEIYL
jgi:hypothetical protein